MDLLSGMLHEGKCGESLVRKCLCIETLNVSDDGVRKAPKRVGLKTSIWTEIKLIKQRWYV